MIIFTILYLLGVLLFGIPYSFYLLIIRIGLGDRKLIFFKFLLDMFIWPISMLINFIIFVNYLIRNIK